MNKFKKIKQGVLAVGVLGLIFYAGQSIGQNVQFKPISQLTEEQQAILAVRQAKLSVVTIVGTKKEQEPLGEGFQLVPDAPFFMAEGTGFVWDESGIIVSNSHVVSDDSLKYAVKLLDGRTFSAEILGLDKISDIAVLKITAQNLVPAKLGNSESLETGQSVFAIGNSLGRYQNTVTRGIVSALGRTVNVNGLEESAPRLQNLIQTDAAINLGNSGGPLINLLGEVVGVNTLIDSEAQGVGFAIPINLIISTVPQLRDLGKVPRPKMGVSFRTIDDVIRILEDYPSDSNGALITLVALGGPADIAGIKAGDIIIEINRETVNESNELDSVVRRYEAGNRVLVSLMRNGERIDMPLILGSFE